MFRLLKTKLMVLYASLFAAILLMISLAAYAAISDSALRVVRQELVTSGLVFDRVWSLRSAQLENGAALLARDFGFRESVATNDTATIQSALDNLKARLGIDLAFMIGVDGQMTAASDAAAGVIDARAVAAMQAEDASGIMVLGGMPYEVVSVPVNAPMEMGRLVFGAKLDRAQMASLEGMAAIPLNASILYRSEAGGWRDDRRVLSANESADIDRLVGRGATSRSATPRVLETAAGGVVALAKPLRPVEAGEEILLVTRYPTALVMAPYQILLGVLIGVGALGLIAFLLGTWALARSITRPISALEEAARRLQRGEPADLTLVTNDEIGRLAATFNVMAADIGQRERELEATRTFMNAIVENLPAMVVVKDVDSRFVLLNRAGEELLGVKREDFVGKTDHDLFPADQADDFVARDRAVMESGRLAHIAEEPIETADKGLRYLQTKKIAIPDADGESQYLLAICEDITERKMAAHALELARDEAEAANRAKSSFLANMSHEVRTPLNGVLGVAGVLAQSKLNPKQREMVEIIENSASVLQRVLNDVLDLARVEAGRLQITEDAFNLEEAIQALVSSAQVQCQSKGLSLTLELDPKACRMVGGDRVRLEQILGNLLSNAVKFTEAGGVTLVLSSAEDDPCCFRFEVRDTGIGFDSGLNQEIFQPFQQADNSITRRFGGSGLGLSISRELARAMGGELTAAGTPGEGAVFTLTLSLALVDHSVAAAPMAAEIVAPSVANRPSNEGGCVRILLADDHETNRTVVRLIFDSMGVELVSVENGALAVEAFKAQPFDLVLMDMQMPVMDGLTAIGLIRDEETVRGAVRTPILVLSANAMAEHVEAARTAGADGHLAKPITPPMLIAAVEQALDAGEQEVDRQLIA